MIKADSTERRRKKVLETSAHSSGTWGMIKGEGWGAPSLPPKKGKVQGTWALSKVSWVGAGTWALIKMLWGGGGVLGP